MVTPSTFTMTSRPQHVDTGPRGTVAQQITTDTHRQPAQIHRVTAGNASRGVTTPVPRVYLPASLTRPGPSGSAGPVRLCRGCSHPPPRSPDQAAASFTPPLRRPGDQGLPPPSGSTAPRGAPRVAL